VTLAAHIERRRRQYRRAARRYEALHQRVDRVISVIATIRFVSFTVFLICAFAAVQDRAYALYLPIAAGGALVFAASVWLHRRPFAMAPRLAALAQISREGDARLAGDWDALPDDGARFLRAETPALGELQIFGRCSLYQLINRAALPGSRRRVATLLAEGASAAEIPQRQAAATELSRLSGLRRRLAGEGRLVEFDEAALEGFLSWAETGRDLTGWLRPQVWLAALLIPLTVGQMIATVAFEMPTFWSLSFLAQCALFAYSTRTLTPLYQGLIGSPKQRPVVALRHMFRLVESRRFQSEALVSLQKELVGGREAPSRRMARFERIIDALAVRHSALMYAVVSIGIHWEIFQCARLERWRARHGMTLRRELEVLADFEALASMGAFASDHPSYGWATVRDDEAVPVFSGQGLGHPLFDVETRRRNDFVVNSAGRLVLITGSNMSGKSSFLRTVGINARLALSGGPVCGDSLDMVRCVLATSIQVTDAPDQGMSRFYAEVKRIAGVVVRAEEASDGGPHVLYLVDEMLSGTNSRERHLACRAVVQRLVDAHRSFGLVTTHDLELVGVVESLPEHVDCMHFSDRFDGEKLHFDYTLKEGTATTTNALHVMRMEGIDVPAAGPQSS